MVQGKISRSRTFDGEYLPIAGVEQVLCVSERLAHSLIHDPSDPIPHFRVGTKLVRVKRSELHEWMERRRVDETQVDRIVQEILG